MTRNEAKTWLIDVLGIEEPSNAQVSALLNHNRDVESAYADRIKAENEELYKGYAKPEEVEKLKSQIADLKDKDAKALRLSKYKELGINEKWLGYADSVLKDSKNMDEDLKNFVTNNPELMGKVEPKQEEPKEDNRGSFGFSGASSSGNGTDGNLSGWEKKFYELNPDLK